MTFLLQPVSSFATTGIEITTTVHEKTDGGDGVLLQRQPFRVARRAVVLQAVDDEDVRHRAPRGNELKAGEASCCNGELWSGAAATGCKQPETGTYAVVVTTARAQRGSESNGCETIFCLFSFHGREKKK